MQIDWHKLRAFNGSQQSAFEELCCQLAACEPVPDGVHFERKGTPDAGVECYWQRRDGSEWGWQAKFFLESLGNSQWQQIDKSVKTALAKHSRLTNYTICIPQDKPDARTDNEKSFKDKWDDQVEKWKGWARARKMDVEFKYWGSHEIFFRLSAEEHVGSTFFWFHADVLNQQWFENHLETVIEDAGDRYTPLANVELPFLELFHGLARENEFVQRFNKTLSDVSRQLTRVSADWLPHDGGGVPCVLTEALPRLLQIGSDGLGAPQGKLPLRDIEQKCAEAAAAVEECYTVVRRTRDDETAAPAQQRSRDSNVYHLRQLADALTQLERFVSADETRLAETPVLLLVGDAGTGKTHLFCDVATRRVRAGLPTVLLLGEKFINDEPWSQMTRILHLTCEKPEELLGALNAAGEAAGTKALLMIDALNEGDGKRLWHKYLAGILATARRYPWVAIAISVRSSYEELVVPAQLNDEHRIRVRHTSFEGHEYEAARTYFDYYEIDFPSVPLLSPEFQNALFLKLFCKGLHEAGLRQVPDGSEGISRIFIFFVDAVNKKLAHPDRLNQDPKDRFVWRAINGFCDMMLQTGKDWLPRSEARAIADGVVPATGHEGSLLQALISEGLLGEERFFQEGCDELQEGIRFTYERLKDYVVARRILETRPESSAVQVWLRTVPALQAIAQTPGTVWWHRGLLEMLAILLPETEDCELFEVMPNSVDAELSRKIFIESLPWRQASSVGARAVAMVGDCLQSTDARPEMLDALLCLAPRPGHPLNAEFLHGLLMPQGLAERDSWWSLFLFQEYQVGRAVDRLVDWAWSETDRPSPGDEALFLIGTTLTWFFTTSHRFLRDRATKALVCLLQRRLRVFLPLIERFVGTNDPYVLERLLAAACGAAMRSTDDTAVGELAQHVYDCLFAEGEPPVHVMTRDYAQVLIDLAIHRGNALNVDEAKFRPPHGAAWVGDVPAEAELDELYGSGKEYWHIWSSVMSDISDFANYVIGSSFGYAPWTSWRRGKPRPKNWSERSEQWLDSLSPQQREAWETHLRIEQEGRMSGLALWRPDSDPAARAAAEKLERDRDEAEQALRADLEEWQRTELDTIGVYLLAGANEGIEGFDVSLAQRWILNRVMDLGWTPDRFGEFDKRVPTEFRKAEKAERIGKKYQWIALHEFLARVSDNFEYIPDVYHPEPGEYRGAWQLSHARDMDPSMVLRKTNAQQWRYEPCWWAPATYQPDRSCTGDTAWLHTLDDWPDLRQFVSIRHPQDTSEWLVLHTHLPWEGQRAQPDDRLPRRRSWCEVEAYLVRRSHFKKVLAWAKKQHYWGRWMPAPGQFYGVYAGEYPWADAWTQRYEDEPDTYDWVDYAGNQRGRIPHPILVTNQVYLGEAGTLDCSLANTVSFRVPCPWIIEKMGLRWEGREGEYRDQSGRLVALDPTVRSPGPAVLLFRKESLIAFLTANKLCLFWVIIGEKAVYSEHGSHDELPGSLEVNGVAWMEGEAVEVELHPYFRKPGDTHWPPLLEDVETVEVAPVEDRRSDKRAKQTAKKSETQPKKKVKKKKAKNKRRSRKVRQPPA